MKHASCILLVLFLGTQLVADLGPFQSILRDIHRQSAQFQNSHEHQEIRSTRDREYGVGDQDTFWRWNLTVMPPAWETEIATCRAVGEHCYVFVADSEWDLHMDQDDVDLVLGYLEDETMAGDDFGAIEMDTLAFGPIPDELDNDPRLIVYYTALGSFNGTSFDGYFSSYNQVTEAQAQMMNPSGHSNECEMIYMTCHPLNPTDPIRISVLAHELQHLIHWGGDINEDTWVDEGCAELAMVLFGMPDPITSFNSNPDNDLTNWDNTTFASYVKVMLFFTYLNEQYGGGDFIKDIVSEPLNGINGLQAQLEAYHPGTLFDDVFFDWTIANYLDDTSIDQGQYGYTALDLPGFHVQNQNSSFPATGSGNMQQWASEYSRLMPQQSMSLAGWAEADTDFNLALLTVGDAGIDTTVEKFTDDTSYYIETEFWEDLHSNIVLVFSGLDNDIAYEYDIVDNTSVDDETVPVAPLRLSVGPNPFRATSTVRFSLNQAVADMQVSLYDIRGRLVRELPAGITEWNGCDAEGRTAPSGVYLYRVEADGESFAGKLLLTR
ncbi:MAG: T9SS type A sorting domain-containing protein [Candidatus Cloacimonetes bacterium]|nr:T9SS type A sorting domain-containing protein [Candidatus Cloacimonadota bacterium]